MSENSGMENESVTSRTRASYHELHIRQDEGDKKRFRGSLSTEFLEIAPDYFKNKKCADLGCGSVVNGTFNLLNMGAEFVHAMDSDESFVIPAKKELSQFSEFDKRYSLDVGSLHQLPYDDQFFDFVLCQGVIHHVDDDKKAVMEIGRVLKPGGHCFLEVQGKGGLMSELVFGLLKKEYEKGDYLKEMIDSPNAVEKFGETISWINEKMENDGSEQYKKCSELLLLLRELVDESFFLTVQDRLHAPLYKEYEEPQFAQMLSKAGIGEYRRLYRMPTFNNIRKIAAPLYAEVDHPLSKFLYGTGVLHIFGTKTG